METISFPMEIEGKFRVADVEALRRRLVAMAALELSTEQHTDTYLKHPSRDFRITDEALRMRCIDGTYWVTYKGPRREGHLKMRPEIELPLQPGTEREWFRIWQSLGFEQVASVAKSRQSFRVEANGRPVTVTLDMVEGIGSFTEIERIVQSEAELDAARDDIDQVALRLGLDCVEKRSYLSMVLERIR
jgi:adenylate cyclase, class 2